MGLGVRRKAFKVLGRGQIDPRPANRSGDPARVLGYLAGLMGPIRTVVDVGASTGIWTEEVRPHWPDARFLLIEAQDVHFAELEAYAGSHANVYVEKAAASDHVGEIHFLSTNPWGGSASAEAFSVDDVVLPCITVDTAVERHQLDGPYILKLDTHGHEREILAGAEHVLEQAALVVIEAYNFANFGRMTFWELCAAMVEYGFRPAGLFDPMTRPSDGLLWQMDLAFLPASRPCFTGTTYGA